MEKVKKGVDIRVIFHIFQHPHFEQKDFIGNPGDRHSADSIGGCFLQTAQI